WEYLHRPDALGVHATETLDTFVRHANQAAAIRWLAVIAGDHGRSEGLRAAAVEHLMRQGAAEEIRQLMGLLWGPPGVPWALHLALLEAVVDLDLPTPDLGHLWAVDNLHVQEAVARLRA